MRIPPLGRTAPWVFVPLVLWAVSVTFAAPSTTAMGVVQSGPNESHLVTLWALDERAASLDPVSGTNGADFANGQIGLTRAALAYHAFAPEMLSFGFRDGERAALLDLGDFRVPPLVVQRDLTPRTPVTAFHSLTLERGKLQYIAPINRPLLMLEGQSVLGPLPPEGIQHVEPRAGHIYLLRSQSPAGELFVKILVLDVQPGRSITLRYAVLDS